MINPNTENKKPFFIFPDIRGANDFSFEKLDSNNFPQLYLMFENDDNIFTDERFKHYDSAQEFANFIETYGAYSPKHSGQDWLWLWKGNYAGVLHLYDLSLETFADNNKRCWIGFTTKPSLRNQGITKKAVLLFIEYIFKNYPLIKFIHAMTYKENKISKQFLISLGFKKDNEERMSQKHDFFIYETMKL